MIVMIFFFLQICHQTRNPNCPWRDLTIDANAVYARIIQGDVIGSCAASCSECDEFDEDTCQCISVTCPPVPTYTPTDFPTYFPSTSYPTFYPTVSPTETPTETPTLNPTISSSPSIFAGKSAKDPTFSPTDSSTLSPTA